MKLIQPLAAAQGTTLNAVLRNQGSVFWPVSGDATAIAHKPFTPSAGNLWAQPGVCLDQEFRDLARWVEAAYGIPDVIN